jgi:hypothetical protein
VRLLVRTKINFQHLPIGRERIKVMQRQITITLLTLSLLLGSALWSVGHNVKAKARRAVAQVMASSQLDPNDFTSLER